MSSDPQPQPSHYSTRSHGFWSVLFALIGNGIITIIKFIGFLMSGSGALFSESIHSFADTLNQSLLMVGIKRSSKSANSDFSYGFGKERFLRALISACGIFFIGAGITLYHGVLSFFHGQEIILNNFIFIILAISFVVEGFTFGAARRELKHRNPHMKIRNLLIHGDPVTLAVVYEDGIALIGVLIAATSLLLYSITGNPLRDSVGSVLIGVLLGIMALFLIHKNRQFLIGKSIPEHIKDDIIELLEQEDVIEKVIDFKSGILDIDAYRIKCEIECNEIGLLKEISKHNFLKKEYERVKDDYQDFLEFCIDLTSRVPRILGTKIDEIEKKIKTRFPQIKHIDIEIN
ncbi:MAG: cation diffusion facilitator family transporter [Candidatus Absconditicoccaceae bacterium]